MRNLLLVSAFVGVLLTSCAPKFAPSTQGPKPATSTTEQIVQGKTIFENSCGKCHALPDPASHNAVQWVGIMNAMAPKAKLNDEQHQWVYDYIVSVNKK